MSVVYGTRVVLDNVNFSVPDGLTAVTGPSGSGKTTLLSVLAGRQRRMRGRRIEPAGGVAVGWILQSAPALLSRTALDNVALGAWASGSGTTEGRRQAVVALASLGLDHLVARRASTLSGGELQRAVVARAMISHSGLVLADEPTASLDAHNALKIGQALRELANHKPVVMATHDLRVAALAAQRFVLTDGSLVDGA